MLVHRRLGITDMTSIEQDTANKERFKFNLPFSCITMQFGKSSDVLPRLPWKARTIVWMDYDGILDDEKLADAQHIATNAVSGSMIVMTVNAEPGEADGSRVERLRERLGSERVPPEITNDSHLGSWGTARAYRNILTNELLSTVSDRNGIAVSGSRIVYRPLFNFQYSDGARMTTVGGIFYSEAEAPHAERCSFKDLKFVSETETAYRIEVPNLTFRELRHLDAQLPVDDARKVAAVRIAREDVKKYVRVYRYFPNFLDAEF
jgi:hypothetical protein